MPIPQHCRYWVEHWEESWRAEETCCFSDFSEKPSVTSNMNNFQGVKKKKNNNTLIQAVRVDSQDIGIENSIEKCAMLVMKSGECPMMDKTAKSRQS